MKTVRIRKTARPLSGTLSFPGDKSLSHRALIFGSLAEGESSFSNVSAAEDCLRTRKAFESMGVEIHSRTPTDLKITGCGLRGLRRPERELYLGNSGTSMRLLLGVLAGQDFDATLTGDPSLSSRPMRRVTAYLRKMGASIEGRDEANFAPLKIHGGRLHGIEADLLIPSAQVKSAVLLAGLYAEGKTTVNEPVKSRDHTERFLSFFGAPVRQEGLRVSVDPARKLCSRSFEIAGDISSAAFFMALAVLLPKACLRFRSVLWNPTRTGMVDVLEKMGMRLTELSLRQEGPEPVADFALTPGPLGAFEIKKQELPFLIDEIPVLVVLATQANGESVIRDAEELRVKETDRIQSMVKNLSKMGADIRVEGNTLIIKGPTPLRGTRLESFQDHRTAMSLVVAGLVAKGETIVKDVDCVNTSFPGFFELLGRVGGEVELR